MGRGVDVQHRIGQIPGLQAAPAAEQNAPLLMGRQGRDHLAGAIGGIFAGHAAETDIHRRRSAREKGFQLRRRRPVPAFGQQLVSRLALEYAQQPGQLMALQMTTDPQPAPTTAERIAIAQSQTVLTPTGINRADRLPGQFQGFDLIGLGDRQGMVRKYQPGLRLGRLFAGPMAMHQPAEKNHAQIHPQIQR